MAASQHRGGGFRSRHTDDDGREALTLCGPALTQQLLLSRGDTNVSHPHDPPEAWEWHVSPRLIIATTMLFSHLTWSESSGYESVEASRAIASQSGMIAGLWRQQSGETHVTIERSRLVLPRRGFGR
jgi:hypothetical protein